MSGKAPNNSMLRTGTRVLLRRCSEMSSWPRRVRNGQSQVPVADLSRSAALSVMRVGALIFVATLALIGCATEHYTCGQGNAGQFILQNAIRYGGIPTSTNGLPVFISRWRYLEDEHGMQIHLPAHDYSNLEAFLNEAFVGEPQFGPSGSSENKTRIHGYRMTQKGGGIQLSEQDSGTLVLVLRPVNLSR